jgi:hypothetical protein
MESYIAATVDWRQPDDEVLFLSIQRPHRLVTSSTVGRWITNHVCDMLALILSLFQPISLVGMLLPRLF